MSTTKQFETILFEVQEGIGYLTINRPDKLNALNQTVLSELGELLTSLHKDSQGCRGLILTGAGERAFIAGADIAAMASMSKEEAREFGRLGQEVSERFEQLGLQTIAAVSGFALGGGCEMAMACDMIFADQSAVFGQPEVKLGLIPGFGGTQRLPRLVGRGVARELIYTGRNMAATEAKDIGLVVKLLSSRDELMAAAKSTIRAMIKCSPLAISEAKMAINDGSDVSLSEGLNIELDRFVTIFQSDEMVEGTTAFLEKRKPSF